MLLSARKASEQQSDVIANATSRHSTNGSVGSSEISASIIAYVHCEVWPRLLDQAQPALVVLYMPDTGKTLHFCPRFASSIVERATAALIQ